MSTVNEKTNLPVRFHMNWAACPKRHRSIMAQIAVETYALRRVGERACSDGRPIFIGA